MGGGGGVAKGILAPSQIIGGGLAPLLPTPMKYLTSISLIFLLFCKSITGSKVGSYKDGHIASILQRDMRTRVKKHNKSTALGRSEIEHVEYWENVGGLLGGKGMLAPSQIIGGGGWPPAPPPLLTPMKYLTSILLIFLLLCKNITGSKVGSYKGGHIASTLQRDIRTRLKKRNRSTAFGRSKI